ncbi:hypothetical protein NXH76_25995 [Blautia schinkii]|nr:hypothetical protein [Blautia schinkii]
MKKFLIAAVSLILLYLLLDTAYYRWGFYIDLDKENETTTFATVDGKNILVDTGKGMKPYEIKGIDLGAGIPGHFATEYEIDKATYIRWFGMIQDMGANTIRVYTILSPDFYEAVYEYNTDNEKPLYILHGVWVNDYIQNSHVDAYDDSFFDTFKKDCRTLVDILHGNKKLNLGYSTSSASGTFTKDISQWVLGYILGVEWEDVTVEYTNHMKEEWNSFEGKYMYTTDDATPFEAMLAQVGDFMISYESDRYHEQRLIAFSNWPTTDPFDYPEVIDRVFMKCAKIDVEHIRSTGKYLAGQFASYHIYSYYPDYLSHYDEWITELPYAKDYKLENGKYNTYGIYLEMINRHHDMPVVISEFGVPTSRGRAQSDVNTERSQGYMSEEEQGEALVQSYRDIKKAGCAGAVIFSWQDEWFKRTWNTMANVDLSYTAYWSDFQTNEQFFGLLTFDPGKEKSICYVDGDVAEWKKENVISKNGEYELSMMYDEKFLYFRIYKEGLDFENKKLYIPVDVTPKSGSYYADREDVKFERPTDFLIVSNGKNNSKVFVQKRYDAFTAVYGEIFQRDNPYQHPPDSDSPEFTEIYLALQVQITAKDLLNLNAQLEKFETGRLTYGNGNPESEDYSSISDFIAKGDNIEIRIPWQLLNFSNPAKMQVHDDYFENYGIENLDISELYAGIGSEADKDTRIPMGKLPLKGWGKYPTYHERLKQSYYAVQEMWTGESTAQAQ